MTTKTRPVFVTVLAVVILWRAGAVETSSSEDENRGMARLLGSPEKAKEFMTTVWGGDKPFFFPASSNNNISSELWWSFDLSKEYMKKRGGTPWVYEEGKCFKFYVDRLSDFSTCFFRSHLSVYIHCFSEKDIKIVKSGKVYFESRKPGVWEDVEKNLGEGATVVMHHLQHRHEPIRTLSAELEDELEVFSGANSYLTPAGSMGFDPHFDWHDILVIQLEGSKTWTVCEQREVDIYDHFREGHKKLGIFQHGEDFGNCTEFTFRPGDLFYAPLGTIHYAEADAQDGKDQQYSMHLTISLIRQQFTWGLFFQDMAETETKYYSARLSKLVSKNKKLESQLPMTSLREIGYSIDNDDLLSGFLDNLRQHAQELVTNEMTSSPQLQTFLLSLLDESKPIFEETVSLYRYKMVMGRLKETHRCPSSGDMQDLDHLSYRRFPHQRIMLEELDIGIVAVTGQSDDEQQLLPSKWSSGLRYVFSGRSRDRFFTVQDIVDNTKMSQATTKEMLKELMQICLLDWKRDESCAA